VEDEMAAQAQPEPDPVPPATAELEQQTLELLEQIRNGTAEEAVK